MAEHAGSAELTDAAEADLPSGSTPPRVRKPGTATVLWLVAAVALASLGGWLGLQVYHERQAKEQRAEFIQAARQGALNLTTIDYKTAEADVARILNSSTGTFHDDFDKRSKPFIDVVKKAQSTSEGTITAAGLESQDGDQAKVLVVASVKMSDPATKESAPALWRMRISVTKSGDTTKMSEVQFVP